MTEEYHPWMGSTAQESSLEELKKAGLHFLALQPGSGHYRVWHPRDPQRLFDFWPTTGKYYELKTRQGGRGVLELIKILST